MASSPVVDQLLDILSAVMSGLVADNDADLTARGLAILLMIETVPGPHTVRAIADRLAISKPSVSRTLDRLEALGLARRVVDAADRRSVLVSATKAGAAYFARVGRLARKAAGNP